MSKIIQPGAGVLYMKVGTHAQEDLSDIIARKQKEIADVGYAMWGYGGSTCYPTSMVQPFARSFADRGRAIHLVMHKMNSRHRAEQVRAERFSVDGSHWQTIPQGINVLGSRYALVIRNLREYEDELNLAATRVGVGRNQGRLGSRYIQGQADKACLEVVEEENSNETVKKISIELAAELIDPYAVFLSER